MSVSVDYLTKYLRDNPKDIMSILENTGFYHISFFEYSNEIRCAWEEGGNPTSVCINVKNLLAICYSKNVGGTLFTLIMQHNNWSLFKVLDFVSRLLKIEGNEETPFIFGGFYKSFRNILGDKKEIPIYSKSLLDKYIKAPNIRFLKDRITFQTQLKFNVMYDPITSRIIVPWYNKNGDLVGASGRYNFEELGNNPKWKAMLNFPKGNFLYGMFENKKGIEEAGYVIIGESEKFVMQLDSYGYHNGLALGGCNISDTQARLIKSLPIDKVIIALDEGLNLEHVLEQTEKLKGGIFNNNKEIYVIFDNDYNILPKGSKMAPTDVGKENFEILLKKYCYRKE